MVANEAPDLVGKEDGASQRPGRKERKEKGEKRKAVQRCRRTCCTPLPFREGVLPFQAAGPGYGRGVKKQALVRYLGTDCRRLCGGQNLRPYREGSCSSFAWLEGDYREGSKQYAYRGRAVKDKGKGREREGEIGEVISPSLEGCRGR